MLQRNWEETAMCINCVHSDRFLIIWETFFVQCSYAMLVRILVAFGGRKDVAPERRATQER